jgi:bacillithiol system protein YtxJ
MEDEASINEIIEHSKKIPVLIFKHSTRCGVSSFALKEFEKAYDIEDDKLALCFLDLLAYRNISNTLADTFGIMHQSPQVLLIKDGKCIYDASHSEINIDSLKSQL